MVQKFQIIVDILLGPILNEKFDFYKFYIIMNERTCKYLKQFSFKLDIERQGMEAKETRKDG